MANAWPTSLADCFLLSGFSRQQMPMTIRSEVEVGLPKVRRRYTKPIVVINGSLVFTLDQVKTFNLFYNVTLKGGVESFIFNDPISQTDQEFRFIEPPIVTPVTDGDVKIQMHLEQTD